MHHGLQISIFIGFSVVYELSFAKICILVFLGLAVNSEGPHTLLIKKIFSDYQSYDKNSSNLKRVFNLKIKSKFF